MGQSAFLMQLALRREAILGEWVEQGGRRFTVYVEPRERVPLVEQKRQHSELCTRRQRPTHELARIAKLPSATRREQPRWNLFW